MNKSLSFFIIVFLGIAFCVGAGYYIFWYQAPKSTSPLGIVVNPGKTEIKSDDLDLIRDDYEERKVGVAQINVDWGEIEKNREENDWKRLDNEISYFDKQRWRVSLGINMIDGYALGEQPTDFIYIDFYNKLFQERFSEFVLAVMERYDGKVDYLVLGSDVDKFLFSQPDQLEAFNLFYNTVYYRVKTNYPEVKIGTSFSYDNLSNTNNLNTFKNNFALEQDFLGFSFYNIDSDNKVKNIDQVDTALDEMLKLAGDKKLSLVATGISNLEEYNSNNDKQNIFVKKLIETAVNNREKIEFVNYYSVQDPDLEYCLQEAEDQIFAQIENTERCQSLKINDQVCSREIVSSSAKENLGRWRCSHGLRNSDGVPQLGFYSWKDAGTTLNVNFE